MGMLDDFARRGPAATATGGRHRLHTLKHLNIVYQALLATAWIAEKSSTSIGAATMLLEEGLWDLRRRLPTVRPRRVDDGNATMSPANAGHPAFLLSMCDLHQGTAELYFYKGVEWRQPRPDGDPAAAAASKGDGHLLMADYHYCVALHEARRAISLGRDGRLFGPPSSRRSTDKVTFWPDTLACRVSGVLIGLANTWWGRMRMADFSGGGQRAEPAGRSGECEFLAWIDEEPSKLETALGTWLKAPIPPPSERQTMGDDRFPRGPRTVSPEPWGPSDIASSADGWGWLLDFSEREHDWAGEPTIASSLTYITSTATSPTVRPRRVTPIT